MFRATTLPAVLLSIALALPARSADDGPSIPSIVVSGVAEVQVAPDQVVVSLGVQTFAKALDAARKTNSERIGRILAAAETLGIESRDVQAGHMSVALRYEYVDGAYRYDRLAGYDVDRSVSLKLNDITKLDALMSAVLADGANRVYGLDFRTSTLRAHRDEARRMALEAAREKATQMAGVLDQKVGRPLRIVEADDGRSRASLFNAWSNSISFDTASNETSSETFAPGTITVKAGVTVEFELQ